jgi:hypothetical protein
MVMLLALMLVPQSVFANPGTFTGSLTIFVGEGTGLPGTPGNLLSYPNYRSDLAVDQPLTPIAFAPGLFSDDRFEPMATAAGGSVPLPTTPLAIYVIGQVVNQSTGASSFAPGMGPAGGFGGTMDLGSAIHSLLGLSGVQGTFGSIVVPLGAGRTGTQTAMARVVGNPLTVTAYGTGWTTGRIQYGTGVSGTPLATAGAVTGNFFQHTSRNSHPTDPSGGVTTILSRRISLVTPILVYAALDGAPVNTYAGYAKLQFQLRQVAPEPGISILIGAIGLTALGRARQRRAR